MFNEWYVPRNYTETCLADKIEIKNKIKVNMQYDAKLFVGLVPKQEREADWKMVYKTFNSSNLNFWTLRIICQENAYIEKSIKARVSLVVLDHTERIVQVEQKTTFLFDTNSHFEFPIEFKYPNSVKSMFVLVRRCLF